MGQIGGYRGDDGLSRADVSLKEPVHWFFTAEVSKDLIQNTLLRLGE